MFHPQRFLFAVALCILAGTHGHLSTAHAQVLSPGDSLVLVDANETIVGKIFGFLGRRADHVHVAFNVDPFVVTLVARKDRLEWAFTALWETANCTGNPVIDANADLDTPLANQIFSAATSTPGIISGKPLGKVYVADPNDTPHKVTIGSKGGNPSGCGGFGDTELLVVNTIEILDLDSLFTPPFHATVVSETRKGGGPKKK